MSRVIMPAQSGGAAAALAQASRLLVIMPGYAAPGDRERFDDGGMLGNLFVRRLTALRSADRRGFVRQYRDFYANPRSDAYMAQRVHEVLGDVGGRRRTVLAAAAVDLGAALPPWASEVRRMPTSPAPHPGDLPDLAHDHDAVLLVHADALGLGLGPTERTLVAALPGKVWVLNGRRRLYRLDGRMRRRLRRRRVLAETRIVEAALARLVPAAAAVLAFVDRLSARKAA